MTLIIKELHKVNFTKPRILCCEDCSLCFLFSLCILYFLDPQLNAVINGTCFPVIFLIITLESHCDFCSIYAWFELVCFYLLGVIAFYLLFFVLMPLKIGLFSDHS
ncbi:hypothetical protein NE237_023691 [Protea cynaroides]|uniref:Uncharacterized protein n=1 Tax=Protea cynaroides TaxID=273540 RepID=A0A9Q0K5M5_9MAGN|nr:hypothetical protein NE237_023691 [Protea cynaroides]